MRVVARDVTAGLRGRLQNHWGLGCCAASHRRSTGWSSQTSAASRSAPLRRVASHARPLVGRQRSERAQASRDLRFVGGIEGPAVQPGKHQVGRASASLGNQDRQPGRHRFIHHQAPRLTGAGKHKAAGVRVERKQLARGLEAREVHLRRPRASRPRRLRGPCAPGRRRPASAARHRLRCAEGQPASEQDPSRSFPAASRPTYRK